MIRLDRRQLIATAAIGASAGALPAGRAFAQAMAGARGFTHSVASGEPGPDTMLVWTRYVGGGDDAHVTAEIATTPDFVRPVAAATMITGPWRDWTVKLTLDGLRPDTGYYYRFTGPDGSRSPIGLTRTLPVGPVRDFAIGVFSCANLPFGWFNAYGHAAARRDLKLWVHLGDYFYEYKRGVYPGAAETRRVLEPPDELLAIADYRARYAAYRADPDLQALHARLPMIASQDDHESANDSWEGGAENHDPATEGDWATRKAAAYQAYREWLPVDDLPYKEYAIGTLATLYKTDTRVLARSRQPDLAGLAGAGAGDATAALTAFAQRAWRDPAVTMMGTAQESWLTHAMRASTTARTTWQVLGVGTIMGRGFTPAAAAGWLAPDAPDRVRRYVATGLAAAKAGLPFNFDAWGGYPAARDRLLRSAQTLGANLIVLSGDSHNGWAWDLAADGRPAAVEFSGHSVTSPGYESATRGVDPATVAAAMVRASPELRWCDTARRGYMRLSLQPGVAINEWVFMATIAERSLSTTPSHRLAVRAGNARLVPA